MTLGSVSFGVLLSDGISLFVRVDRIADPKKRQPVHKGVLVLYIVYIRAF